MYRLMNWQSDSTKTLCRSLVKLDNKKQDDCDLMLDTILFGYRVAKHRTTGYSPFFMLYHREAHLLIDIELMPDSSENGDSGCDDYIQAMLNAPQVH